MVADLPRFRDLKWRLVHVYAVLVKTMAVAKERVMLLLTP
jgi:hypothetical protein